MDRRAEVSKDDPDPRLGNPEWTDNWTLGAGSRFELVELASRKVFICQQEVTADEITSFDLPHGFGHVLAGDSRADLAYFARSPQATDNGPVETIELDGRRFSFVALPLAHEILDSGATEMTIEKHHSMLYRAGRIIDILDFGDGTMATPAWGSLDAEATLTPSMLADDWRLRRVTLAGDLVTVIPAPARVVVLDNSFGFHGPVPGAVIRAVAAAGARE